MPRSHQWVLLSENLGASAYFSGDWLVVAWPSLPHAAAEIRTLHVPLNHEKTHVADHFVEAPVTETALIVSKEFDTGVFIGSLRCR